MHQYRRAPWPVCAQDEYKAILEAKLGEMRRAKLGLASWDDSAREELWPELQVPSDGPRPVARPFGRPTIASAAIRWCTDCHPMVH